MCRSVGFRNRIGRSKRIMRQSPVCEPEGRVAELQLQRAVQHPDMLVRAGKPLARRMRRCRRAGTRSRRCRRANRCREERRCGASNGLRDRARSAGRGDARAGGLALGLGEKHRERDAETAADLVEQLRRRTRSPRSMRDSIARLTSARRARPPASGSSRRGVRGRVRRCDHRCRFQASSYKHLTFHHIGINQNRLSAATAVIDSHLLRNWCASP